MPNYFYFVFFLLFDCCVFFELLNRRQTFSDYSKEKLQLFSYRSQSSGLPVLEVCPFPDNILRVHKPVSIVLFYCSVVYLARATSTVYSLDGSFFLIT